MWWGIEAFDLITNTEHLNLTWKEILLTIVTTESKWLKFRAWAIVETN